MFGIKNKHWLILPLGGSEKKKLFKIKPDESCESEPTHLQIGKNETMSKAL